MKTEIRFVGEHARRDSWFAGQAVIIHPGDLPLSQGELVSVVGFVKLTADCIYKVDGQVVEYKGAPQLKIDAVTPADPSTAEDCSNYIQRFGAGLGIGPAKASLLYRLSGNDTLRVCRQQPEIVAAVTGISLDNATELSKRLLSRETTEKTTLQVMSILSKHKLARFTDQVVDDYGAAVVGMLKKDPYFLMRYHGIGFLSCDRIFCDGGLRRSSRLRRAMHYFAYRIETDGQRNTWYHGQSFLMDCANKLAFSDSRIKKAYRLGIRFDTITACRDDGNAGLYISTPQMANDEDEIAKHTIRIIDHPTKFKWPDRLPNCTPHQEQIFTQAAVANMFALLGSAGTGKTTMAGDIIGQLIRLGLTPESILVCAPTGKASVRIAEMSTKHKVRSRTIHSALGYDGGGFIHGSHNPLPYKLIVLDEFSMCDSWLLARLLAAIPSGAGVMLIGDPGQLPPVGHGFPFRDFVQSGVVPHAELTEILRNAGGIAHVCSAIRHGKDWNPHDNVTIGRSVISFVKSLLANGASPSDIQVITSMNVYREQFNEELQPLMNHSGKQCHGTDWRHGDRIICNVNGYRESIEYEQGSMVREDKVYCANGEQGELIGVDRGLAIVEFAAPRRVLKVERSDCDLAYAITVHRAQGSQYKFVATHVESKWSPIYSKNWLYTGLSRASFQSHLVGELDFIKKVARKESAEQRMTRLVKKLEEYRNPSW